MEPQELIKQGQLGYSKQQKQLREASSATTPTPAQPVATTIGDKQYTAGGATVNPYGKPITSTAMAPTTPVKLPDTTVPTSPATAQSVVGSTVANNVQAQQTATTQNQPATTSDVLSSFQKELLGLQDQQAEATASIDRTAQEAERLNANRIANEIESEQNATRQQVDLIRRTNPTGSFGGALEDQIRDIERESLIRQTNKAVLLNAANRNFEALKEAADSALALKLEPIKTRIDNAKLFYQENRDIFNKQEERTYQEKIKDEEREYNKIEKEQTLINNFKLDAAKNGASAAFLQSISNKSYEDILTTPGIEKYMQSPLEKMQMQKYAIDIAKGSVDLQKARKELSEIMITTASPGLTQDQRTDLLKNPTAQKAQARIGVIQAVDAYGRKVSEYKKGRLTASELRELNTALKTTVGSAINVAQGQGAMGEEEGKRILDNLEAGRLTREKVTLAAVEGVKSAQDSLLQSEFGFIDSGIPGATDSFQLFSDYKRSKSDPLLVNKTSGIDSLGLGI